MTRTIRFSSAIIKEQSKNISNAAALAENAVKSLNNARNNERWTCPEKDRIAANMQATRDLVKKCNTRVAAYANACNKTADSFEAAEKRFIDAQKNIAGKASAAIGKFISFKGAAAALSGLIAGMWTAITDKASSTPTINKNPFDTADHHKSLGLLGTKDGLTTLVVQFNSDGGTSIKPIRYKKNDTYGRLPDPKFNDLKFKGWTVNGGMVKADTSVGKSGHTLTAAWDVTVKFVAEGGNPASQERLIGRGGKYYNYMNRDGHFDTHNSKSLVAAPTRPRFEIDHWKLPNGTKIDNNTVCNANASHTVHAVWKETSKVELLTNKEVADIQTRREAKKVTDLKTGKSFNISWAASANYHTDWTPMTPADTAVIVSILSQNGIDWNNPSTRKRAWDARPGILELNGRLIAVGFHLFPHGSIMGGNPGTPFVNKSNTRPSGGWDIGGHMCMCYKDRGGGMQSLSDAAAKAYEMSQ